MNTLAYISLDKGRGHLEEKKIMFGISHRGGFQTENDTKKGNFTHFLSDLFLKRDISETNVTCSMFQVQQVLWTHMKQRSQSSHP